MDTYVIEAKEVNYFYPDGKKALNRCSLHIPKGVKAAILGPNGAGKSTLFLHFNGIFKPHSGIIQFQGKPVSYSRLELAKLRQQVGIVFQDPDSQLFSGSVFQEISFGPINLGLSHDEVKRRVYQAMEAVNILHLADKPTHFLSFGEKKRVAIADILVMHPDVLVLDEPTAWLDPKHTGDALDLFNKIHNQGKTVIISTHDVDLAYAWADLVFVMYQGEVIGWGGPEQVFADKGLLDKAHLTTPLIFDVYEKLKSGMPGLNTKKIPRTRDDLFSILDSKF